MKISQGFVAAVTLALLAAPSMAASTQEVADMERILESFPEFSSDEIRPSPMPGIYEISLGSRMAYISADGKYLIQGDLFDTTTEENLTEKRRMAARMTSLDNVSESSMIIFEPQQATHTITVFTDIDCGYCRKLHRQIDDYNAKGIRVRYMSFPRSGPETVGWYKAEKVWCAEDRNTAMTTAKSDGAVDGGDCETTPVADHYALGRTFGIQGTPAIITDSGELIPGYVSPSELMEYFEQE